MSQFLTFNDASEHSVGQKVAFKAPFAMNLVEIVDFRTNVAGTTGDTVFDIEINGASALSNYLAVVSGATTLYAPQTFALTAVAKGDIITIDCDQVASTEGFGFNAVISYVAAADATAAAATGGHDHRFGQPENDAELHDQN